MQTNVVALDQRRGSKYSRVAVELRLVIHSHNRGNERSRDKHMFAHCPQMEDLAIIQGQLGIPELVSCHRASNRVFVDVPRTWVFSITYDFSSCFFPKFKIMHFQNRDIKLYTVVLLFLCFLKFLLKLCCR